jgi:hypothetical protein
MVVTSKRFFMPAIVTTQDPDVVLGTISREPYEKRILFDMINQVSIIKIYAYNSVFSEPVRLENNSVTNTKIVVTSKINEYLFSKTNIFYNRISSSDLGEITLNKDNAKTVRDIIGAINVFLGTYIEPSIVADKELSLPNGSGVVKFMLEFIEDTFQYYPGRRVKLLSDPIDPPDPSSPVEPTYSATWIKTDW